MSMINLEKSQAILAGNFANVKHSAVLQNGFVVNLGARIADEVYAVSVPATATLGASEALLMFSDETMYVEYNNISAYSTPIGTVGKAVHLTVGDQVLFEASLITGAPAENQFLIPADGVMTLAASAAIGSTRLSFQIKGGVTTIGHDRRPAWRAIVVKA